VSIDEIITRRNISEVVHFTTHSGLTGILHQREVKARSLLKADQTLEFILKLNTAKVFDAPWKGHVNLSITRINKALFGYSENWHPDESWRILAFAPSIMCHEGVNFVTTNNAYGQHLKRGVGAQSLDALFADEVLGIYGRPIRRVCGMPDSWTTDIQAEVLYPSPLATEFLRTIYVRTDQDADDVAGVLAALRHPAVPIKIDSTLFSRT
jgi:hypothetical protein